MAVAARGLRAGLSVPVRVAASVYVHDLQGAGVFNDAEDHPVVTSTSRVQSGEFAAQRLAYSLWIVSERPEDELDAGRGDLLWQSLQIAFGPSRDADRVPLLHSGDPVAGLERVVVGQAACGGVSEALVDGFSSARRSEDLQSLLDGGEVVGGDENRSRVTVTGDGHPLVGAFDLRDVLGEPVSCFAKGNSGHVHSVAKRLGKRRLELRQPDPLARGVGGRPALDPAGSPSVSWRSRAPQSLDLRFRALAQARGQTFSEALPDAAEEYIARHANAG